MYEVRLARRAQRYYERVPREMARRLDRCFAALQKNPFGGRDIKPVKGEPGTYRARVGDLRVVYEVERRSRIVIVHLILPRGEAYRR
ncbi:MAG: type II toxin-antitoxin system RelE/ParE family toxin [Candidatus Methylomirabilales bacterium]